MYRLSSKFNAAKQISKRFMRTTFARQADSYRETIRKPSTRAKPKSSRHHHLATGRDPTGYLPPDQHHYISPSRNHPIKLTDWIRNNQHDPAFKVINPTEHNRLKS